MPTFLNRENLKKFGLVLLVILIPVVLALTVNYFSKKHKTPAPQKQVEPKTFQLYLYCPSIKEFCDKGKVISKNNVYLGFGGSVPANTPVKTSFNGKISTSKINLGTEQVSVIYLDNEEGQVRAVYTFKGETADVGKLTGGALDSYIKVGTEIGKITGNMSTYNTSLLFTLIKGNPQTGEKLLLDNKSFY